MEDIYNYIYINAVCSHGGEEWPGIFLRNIHMSCVVTGVSSFTRILPLRNIHRPCVAQGFAGHIPIRNINAVCNHGVFPHQDYSFREYVYAGYIPIRNT